MSTYNISTKEEYFSFVMFVEKVFGLDDFFEEYGYPENDDFVKEFYEFLRKKRFLTTSQNMNLIALLMKNDNYTGIEDIEEILVEDISEDYKDIATLTTDEFKAMYCWFISINDSYGKELIEEVIDANVNLNWEYLLKNIPNTDFPKINIQNTECIISSKDFDSLRSGIESLDELCANLEDSTSTMMSKIIKSMKKIIDKIES